MSETLKFSPETNQPYDPWQELGDGEFGPVAPPPESDDLKDLRELGQKTERQRQKVEFYEAMGSLTTAVINGESIDEIQQNRPQAQNAFQRLYEKRTDRKMLKLTRARLKRDASHKGGLDQTYGITPALRQQKKLGEVTKKYKSGELTLQQMEVEKLKVRATRRKSAVRGFGQRRNAREATARVVSAHMHADSGMRGRLRARKLNRLESRLAQAQEDIRQKRSQETHESSAEDSED